MNLTKFDSFDDCDQDRHLDATVSGQADLQEFRDSPVYYEQRSKINKESGRGEWWIAIGVYLIIISIGFVIL